MKKPGKLSTVVFITLLIAFTMTACGILLDSDQNVKSGNSIAMPLSDIDTDTAVELGIVPVIWNGETDRAFAAEIEAVKNNTRKNASGIKITSNAHSDDFPGIYFIWDSKQKDNGYLKICGGVFTLFESFVLTTKEANTYWDFFITPEEGQQMTDDGCYVFFIPKVYNNKNINMVFLSGWVEKEILPPPLTDAAVSIYINDKYLDYGDNIDFDNAGDHQYILISLELSEGSWNDIRVSAIEENQEIIAAFRQWINLDIDLESDQYGLMMVRSGYSPWYDPELWPDQGTRSNPKGLMFLYDIINETLPLPITAAINEEKLDEMKAATDLTGSLTIGIKSATLETIELIPAY